MRHARCSRLGRALTTEIRTVVIVAPSGDRLEEATRLASSRATGGAARVLLVAPGATLLATATKPARPGETNAIERRELGAYRVQPTLTATRELRESFFGWLDDTFAGAFGAFRPRDVLGSCAQLRLFDAERLDQVVLLGEIFARHARDEIIVVAPDFWERSVTDALRGERSSYPSGGRSARRLASRVRFAAMALAGIGATAASVLRDELRGGVSRRASFRSLDHRRLWIALSPDWARHNRHVVEAANLEVDADALGILVFPPLEPGERVEPELVRRPSAVSWVGLAELGPRRRGNAFALSTWGTSPGAFLGGVWSSSVASARVAWRIARGNGDVPLGRFVLPFDEVRGPLAGLCTADVALARRTLAAATDLVERTDFAGSTVLFADSNDAAAATLHLVLRAAGAVTVDYFHGWTMEATPIASVSPAILRLVFSNTDAARVSPEQRVAVLVRQHGARPQIRTPRPARRVLLLTNYAHRDLAARERPYRLLLQREMLRGAIELRRGNPQLELRWRPHPADLPALIEPDSRELGLPFSPTTLAEDLAWADVAVCSISTTILSSLRNGLPVFIHVPAESQLAMSWVAPERAFFRGTELVSQVERYLALAATSPDAAGQPEQVMWDAHFGGPLTTTLRELLEESERAVRGEGSRG